MARRIDGAVNVASTDGLTLTHPTGTLTVRAPTGANEDD